MQNKENNQLVFNLLVFVGILSFVLDIMSNYIFGGFQGLLAIFFGLIAVVYFCILIYISYQLYKEDKDIKHIIISVAVILLGIISLFII